VSTAALPGRPRAAIARTPVGHLAHAEPSRILDPGNPLPVSPANPKRSGDRHDEDPADSNESIGYVASGRRASRAWIVRV